MKEEIEMRKKIEKCFREMRRKREKKDKNEIRE